MRSCKDCGWNVPGEHYSTCPQHRLNQPKPKGDYGPNPYEPKPDGGANDDYISPHSLNAVGEQPVKTPKYREIPTDDPNTCLLEQDGWEISYPHNTWINARESYAKGRDTLENVLQYVTEDNPPPGPPIPVYKPAAEPSRKAASYTVFALLWLLIGLTPMLVYIFMALF